MKLLRTSDNKARLDIPEATCGCGRKFVRLTTLHNKCVPCLRAIGPASRKAEREATRKRKEAIKPRSKWLQEAQQALNAFVRACDKAAGFGCISCGTKQGKENAGHYLSVGARPELRFEPMNIHLQCERCNTYLHGNLIAYRANLIQRIGLEAVDWLEGPHAPKKYTVDDLKAIIATYRAKLRELQA